MKEQYLQDRNEADKNVKYCCLSLNVYNKVATKTFTNLSRKNLPDLSMDLIDYVNEETRPSSNLPKSSPLLVTVDVIFL